MGTDSAVKDPMLTNAWGLEKKMKTAMKAATTAAANIEYLLARIKTLEWAFEEEAKTVREREHRINQLWKLLTPEQIREMGRIDGIDHEALQTALSRIESGE